MCLIGAGSTHGFTATAHGFTATAHGFTATAHGVTATATDSTPLPLCLASTLMLVCHKAAFPTLACPFVSFRARRRTTRPCW